MRPRGLASAVTRGRCFGTINANAVRRWLRANASLTTTPECASLWPVDFLNRRAGVAAVAPVESLGIP